MELIAHRGAPNRRHPENSMGAFRQALRDGLSSLEFDLRLTLDDQLLVLHDSTLKRTAQVAKEFSKTLVGWQSLNDLRRYPLKRSDEVAPTFHEVLELLEAHPRLVLFPELKDHNVQTARRYIETVEASPHRERVIAQSFNHDQLRFINQNSPLQVCPLYHLRRPALELENCQWEAPMVEGLLLSPATVKTIHGAGRKVAAWFVVAERWDWLRRRMESLGVDALMVDTYS